MLFAKLVRIKLWHLPSFFTVLSRSVSVYFTYIAFYPSVFIGPLSVFSLFGFVLFRNCVSGCCSVFLLTVLDVCSYSLNVHTQHAVQLLSLPNLVVHVNVCWFQLSLQSAFEIWAPSSEFVSSSNPSWQILTAHAQPFRGARDLAFCLKVPFDSLLVWASSEGSGETARMRRLAWTFAARIGDKYQIRLRRSIYQIAFI